MVWADDDFSYCDWLNRLSKFGHGVVPDHVSLTVFLAITAAWLNASQKSWDAVGMSGMTCEMLWAVQRTGYKKLCIQEYRRNREKYDGLDLW